MLKKIIKFLNPIKEEACSESENLAALGVYAILFGIFAVFMYFISFSPDNNEYTREIKTLQQQLEETDNEYEIAVLNIMISNQEEKLAEYITASKEGAIMILSFCVVAGIVLLITALNVWFEDKLTRNKQQINND